MSWLYSQALVAEYSAGICSDGEPSAPSSGNPTQPVFSSHDRTTVFSRRSLSGMTFKLLTENHGEAVLTCFLAAFPVRTYLSLTPKGKGLKAPGLGYGQRWIESSVRLDLERFLWKTHRNLWEEDLPESSVTLPSWGMLRDGVCWEGIAPEAYQTVSGSGLSLMRPIASDGLRQTFQIKSLVRKNHGDGNLSEQLARVHQMKLTPECGEILMRWPDQWTDLKPLATGKIHSWQHLHGKHSTKQTK